MFRDRAEAALELAKKLASYRKQHPLILAIPRGGVVIGKALQEKLAGDLDVVLVRKIGTPFSPEFALGAITESGRFLPNEALAELPIPIGYLEQEIKRQLQLIQQRRQAYTPFCKAISPKNRVVILVDDGIATGSTMIAALKEVKSHHPKKIVVAVPVAPADSLNKLQTLVDEVVCLLQPKDFEAVGQFYQEFLQVSDEEVIAMLSPL